jgi:hypothetical protein
LVRIAGYRFDVREAIQEVLLWQTEYSSKGTEAMQRRGELVKREFADELRACPT